MKSCDSVGKGRANLQGKNRHSWRNEAKEWCSVGNFQNKHEQIISQDFSFTWHFILVVKQQNYLSPSMFFLSGFVFSKIIRAQQFTYTVPCKGFVHNDSTSSLLAGIAAETKWFIWFGFLKAKQVCALSLLPFAGVYILFLFTWSRQFWGLCESKERNCSSDVLQLPDKWLLG